MTDTRHPDIEIYVKDRSPEQIVQWLEAHCLSLTKKSSKGTIHELALTYAEGSVEVMIHEKVAGKAWSSIWFKQNHTPWPKDLDCAHQASTEMATQIRCIASGWSDGDDPDEYWKVENQNKEKIQWRC